VAICSSINDKKYGYSRCGGVQKFTGEHIFELVNISELWKVHST
jgi:hypothetical protein